MWVLVAHRSVYKRGQVAYMFLYECRSGCPLGRWGASAPARTTTSATKAISLAAPATDAGPTSSLYYSVGGRAHYRPRGRPTPA